MRVYLDTAPVIYLVEEVPNYADLVDRRVSVTDVVQVASDLTRMECRVKLLRAGIIALLRDYEVLRNIAVKGRWPSGVLRLSAGVRG